MPTTTTNFGYSKPLVNDPTDEDLWGGYLNTNLDLQDGDIYTAQRRVVLAKTGNYTIVAADKKKLVTGDATAGSFTLTLLAAATAGAGFEISFKKIDSSANTVTIDGNLTETIDGALTFVLSSQYDNLTIVSDGTNWNIVTKTQTVSATVLQNYLSGLAISNNAGVPNTKVDIAAGQATDTTNAAYITNAAVKTVDFGTTGANGLDTGAIAASKVYHIWIISKADGTAAGFANRADLTGLAPTLPATYTYKRRIGSVITDASSHIQTFVQNGDQFLWKSPLLDQNNTTIGTASGLITLSIPTGVKLIPLFTAGTVNTSGSRGVYYSSPDQNDDAPSTTTAPIVDMYENANVGEFLPGPPVWTNTSAQIRARAHNAAVAGFYLSTRGWVDRRGRDG